MSIKTIDLSKLDDQPKEVREAIAFFTAFTVLPISFSVGDRERYYRVLEQAGYIEKVGV
ncbi:hypothetical protein P4H66_19575 [Paenibacillus dokdonensis]|uniref:Uncharacterized protein n=1 Tax=Paenibacillus dokdonensis TaxID=2567944 RepID=A0ABU6GSC7_9BACL|nr:hypothetical protein [Paenibacillus dokdonensis]MEC0242007.1 hypothetical protein [Paenibacillus dokdonensis]